MATAPEELASLAATYIAEDKITWFQARQKLLEENPFLKPNHLPNDNQIEAALREYYAIYKPKEHEQCLFELRKVALDVMLRLENYDPILTKGVLNGCADDSSPICLYLKSPDPKEIELFLLDKNIEMEILPSDKAGRKEPMEEIIFEAPCPSGSYFSKKGINIWVSAKIFEEYPTLKRISSNLPDAYQEKLETNKFAGIDDVKRLIDISFIRLHSD